MDKSEIVNSNRPLVLIVDDSTAVRMQAGGFIVQGGFRTMEAVDGTDALRILEKTIPDLILLDLSMPGIDGIELCTLLRQRPETSELPVLMLSGIKDNETISRAFGAGATDFAIKPLNWMLLVERLKYLHRNGKMASDLLRGRTSLNTAQRIAKIGSWQQDLVTGEVEWSDYMYRLFESSATRMKPAFDSILALVPDHQKNKIESWYINAQNSTLNSICQHELLLANGTTKTVKHVIEPDFNAAGKIVSLMAVLQDITENIKIENKVRHLEKYDLVTELSNRKLFIDHLEQEISVAREANKGLILIQLGLEGFEKIVDVLGRTIADQLLRDYCQKLKEFPEICSTGNELSRIGESEFCVLVKMDCTSEDFMVYVNNLLSWVSTSYNVNGRVIHSKSRAGIAQFPKDGSTADMLLKSSSMALSEVKKDVLHKIQLYSPDLQEQAIRNFEIEAQLNNALSEKEFSLHYQPLVDINSGTVYAAEALLRWNNKELGSVSPSEIIYIAERNGLILPIGEWVLNTACTHLMKWRRSGFTIPRVAVNVSTIQFEKSDLPSLVESILKNTGLPASCLELEITESLLVSDQRKSIERLNRLSEMGVILTVDDFGTGYSSLGQIKSFPINRLKIDRSFIANLATDKTDIEITRSIISMGQSLNMSVLAEGVETEEQLHLLRYYNCDEIQGYLISKPLAETELVSAMPEILGRIAKLIPSYPERVSNAG